MNRLVIYFSLLMFANTIYAMADTDGAVNKAMESVTRYGSSNSDASAAQLILSQSHDRELCPTHINLGNTWGVSAIHFQSSYLGSQKGIWVKEGTDLDDEKNVIRAKDYVQDATPFEDMSLMSSKTYFSGGSLPIVLGTIVNDSKSSCRYKVYEIFGGITIDSAKIVVEYEGVIYKDENGLISDFLKEINSSEIPFHGSFQTLGFQQVMCR